MSIDLDTIRAEAAAVPDSRLNSVTRARMRKHPPRGRGKWLSANLYPGLKYTLEIWGDAAFPPKDLLAVLEPLLQAKPKARAAAKWKQQEDATILIPTGFAATSNKPDEMRPALRMLLTALILLDHTDPTAAQITRAS
jgi:hypothetical protein